MYGARLTVDTYFRRELFERRSRPEPPASFNIPASTHVLRPLISQLEDTGGKEYCVGGEARTRDLPIMSLSTSQLSYPHLLLFQNKTMGCTWRSRICGLTLDLTTGFSLYDSESRVSGVMAQTLTRSNRRVGGSILGRGMSILSLLTGSIFLNTL